MRVCVYVLVSIVYCTRIHEINTKVTLYQGINFYILNFIEGLHKNLLAQEKRIIFIFLKKYSL